MGGYGRRVMETIGSTRKEFLKTGFGLKSISKIKKIWSIPVTRKRRQLKKEEPPV
jgi:hypothetical protein